MNPDLLRLLGGTAAVLVVASAVTGTLVRRAAAVGSPSATIVNLSARVRAWWVMVVLLAVAFALGDGGVVVLFGLASFAALREFITLMPTRRGDHTALVASFLFVLPLQYYLVGIEWYGLYSIFIPVYVFLLLPVAVAQRGDTTAFIARVAEVLNTSVRTPEDVVSRYGGEEFVVLLI